MQKKEKMTIEKFHQEIQNWNLEQKVHYLENIGVRTDVATKYVFTQHENMSPLFLPFFRKGSVVRLLSDEPNTPRMVVDGYFFEDERYIFSQYTTEIICEWRGIDGTPYRREYLESMLTLCY